MKGAALELRALKDRESSDESGWRQVAVLLVSLGQELAANLMKDLDSDEVEQIAKAIADLKTVPREVQEQVVAEFEQQLASSSFPASGGEQVSRGILEAALGKDKAGGCSIVWDTARSQTASACWTTRPQPRFQPSLRSSSHRPSPSSLPRIDAERLQAC